MSELWLDTELSDASIAEIARVVQASGLARDELEDVFHYELAPFLGANLASVAGEWSGFDPDWVCAEAQKRHDTRRFVDRVTSSLGRTTHAARPAWTRVLEKAFAS